MGCYGLTEKGSILVARHLAIALTILITKDVTTHGKPVTSLNRTEQTNSSKRHYVVTEEETQDTFFIPQQIPYPVIPHYPVPVVTSPAVQPKLTKPKKHGSEHKEKHVLMPPRKTGNVDEQHASINNAWHVSLAGNAMKGGSSNRNIDEIWDNEEHGHSDTSSTAESTCEHEDQKGYRNVGCYKDTIPRAVPSLEGSDPILTGYYKNRPNAVERCAHVAKSRGYQVFTIQNGGFCSSGPMAHRTFQIYGPASKCRSGKGGKWASDVYIFNENGYELTVHTGIEQRSSTAANVSVALYGVMGSSRHIPLRSHISTNINDPFTSGQIDKFMVHTVPLGALIRLHICLDNTGPSPEWYLETVSVRDPRNKIFIFPCNCWLKRGKKGSISERLLLPAVVINPEPFKYIGCYKSPKGNIKAQHPQEYRILDGRPSTVMLSNNRNQAKHMDYVIELCAQDAHARAHMFFAIHNGHACVHSSTLQDTYSTYGSAYDCSKTGRGGVESIAVYTFTDREPHAARGTG